MGDASLVAGTMYGMTFATSYVVLRGGAGVDAPPPNGDPDAWLHA